MKVRFNCHFYKNKTASWSKGLVGHVYNQSVVKFLQQNLTALGLHTREN